MATFSRARSRAGGGAEGEKARESEQCVGVCVFVCVCVREREHRDGGVRDRIVGVGARIRARGNQISGKERMGALGNRNEAARQPRG